VKEAADLFRLAIHEDTLYAPAYSGLSMALALFPYFHGVPAQDIKVEVVNVARRALDLDSTLAEPHIALGIAYWFDYRWDDAEKEFLTAIERDSSNVEALVQYARHLRFRGRNREAISPLSAARAVDTASALVLSHLAYSYLVEGQLDSALVESRRALENDPTNLTTVGMGAYVMASNNLRKEARALIDRTPNSNFFPVVMARLGDSTAIRRLLRTLDSTSPQPWMANTRRAYYFIGLGDTARAFSALERATVGKEIWPSMNGAFDPIFKSIRQTARFRALLREVGLVDPDSSVPR
jgi:tetratricopeptide (TPR) repeat protein